MPTIHDLRHLNVYYDPDTLSLVVDDHVLHTGNLVIGAVTQSGAWTAAQSGTWTVQPGNTANTTKWLVAATLDAETTKIIGTVNLAAAQTLATVTNLAQLGGAAVSMNTGVRDAGTQRVTIATNDVVPASQSGTWTVQPGNTANTTAWKVDGSAVTQPVSGTFWQATQPVSGTVTANQGGVWTVQPGNTANTTAWKVDGSAVTQPVSGTFWQATQPVSHPAGSIAGATALPAGTANIGDVDVLADVQNADDDAGYADGNLSKNLTQTPEGRLRVAVAGLVSDNRESYSDNQVRSLSLTTDGRLRVSMSPADIDLEFFTLPESPFFEIPDLTAVYNLFGTEGSPITLG